MFEIANVRDSKKFKILAFNKRLGTPKPVFTSIFPLVRLKDSRREKICRYFTVTGVLFSVKIIQNAILFSSCVMHMQYSNLCKKPSISIPTL